MPDLTPYPTAAGVESAIKVAATAATKNDPTLTVTERIRFEYFRRLLSRVFSEGTESEWLLKGGTSMLARIPATRSTLDIDLYCDGFTIDQALADLRRLADLDLGDHFRFVYVGHQVSVAGDQPPYVDAYRVSFDVYIGVRHKGRINVDLATGAGLTAPVTTADPANRLPLPRLISYPYRLYPIVDQVADKVCATMEKHEGQPSSREKDLVDLAVIAVTQAVDGAALAYALEVEARRRRMHPLPTFEVPPTWGRAYAAMAVRIPHLADYLTVSAVTDLVATFIDPALTGTSKTKSWDPDARKWA
ncbi:nucleotidyl transferase AbiEii/AbiGii toxin family protein [Kribbella sp.]|uniref:nucleotidyl transferase AbiEii/AbiGii toxin family protein n=1 Tax=Kribbella sp. TaxID=1871183 RepID=UPI002D656614|nr:nucleotidyl transferase AbiEii/AbiGii toxin family protein [Kribbella sp.]HZX04037.1 nucleotidyl transferase AbiEii/AbiGii toxin family protein [Kribbella sp.]